MDLNELRDKAYAQAVKSGWYDGGDRSPLERHMLMVSEVAEATECVRKSEPPIHFEPDGTKPLGEAIELADVMIRIADYFGRQGWDLEKAVKTKMDYNATRPYRHGNKTA